MNAVLQWRKTERANVSAHNWQASVSVQVCASSCLQYTKLVGFKGMNLWIFCLCTLVLWCLHLETRHI